MTRKQPVSNHFSNIIIGSAWLSWLYLTALVCGGICPAYAADEWSKSMSNGHRALQRKDYKAAEKWCSEAVEQSGRNNAETLGLLRSLSSLAFVYQQENKLAEAIALRKRALSVAEKISGPDHPDVAEALNGLAEVYQLQGNYAESVPLYERAIAIREAKLGTGHAAVASSLNSLAEAARAHADRASAERYFNRAQSIGSKLGPAHPELARSLNGLADVYVEQGHFSDAERLYKQVLGMANDLGKSHTEIVKARNGLATVSARTKPSPPDSDRADQKAAATQSSSPRHWWQLRFGKRSP